MSAKCPKCDGSFTNVTTSEITIRTSGKATYRGIAYKCPMCDVALNVELDPLALKAAIVDDVLGALKR